MTHRPDDLPVAHLQPGDRLGERYRVLRRIAEGGMGAVYEAENTWTTRRVAVKVLRPDLVTDVGAVRRFKQEAQAATKLAHPNIVEVLDMGRDPALGALFIVQELLVGRDLRDHLDDARKLAPRDAFDLLVPVLGALAAAHRQGIVHRDVKPENVFVARDAEGATVPKLIDFGLAKMLGDGPSRLRTRTGAVIGTPHYMSPEQARGESAIDARTDVWAAGAVLFEMLTGRRLWPEDNANAVLLRAVSAAPPRVQDVEPSLPPEVAAVVARALEPDRERRYATADEMLRAVLSCPVAQAEGARPSLADAHRESIPPPEGAGGAAVPEAIAPRAVTAAPAAGEVTVGSGAKGWGGGAVAAGVAAAVAVALTAWWLLAR